MWKMVATRLIYAAISLWVVSVLVFVATQALPSDAAIVKLGKLATPEAIDSFRERYNLDDPLVSQYFDWFGGLLQGQLGVSLMSGVEVGELISGRVLNTLVLMFGSVIIGTVLGVVLGVFTALRRDRAGDHVTSVTLLVVSGLPEFVLALALVALLATNVFQVLPAVSPLDPEASVFSQLDLLILPTLTLVILVLPFIARTVHACMIEALDSEYIVWARFKGISERRVIMRHALPNIAGPSFQVVAQTLAYLAGGVVVVETVFQYPGIGQGLVAAVQSRDLPVVQALSMFLAAFYILMNILADIGTVAMTPTMRKGAR